MDNSWKMDGQKGCKIDGTRVEMETDGKCEARRGRCAGVSQGARGHVPDRGEVRCVGCVNSQWPSSAGPRWPHAEFFFATSILGDQIVSLFQRIWKYKVEPVEPLLEVDHRKTQRFKSSIPLGQRGPSMPLRAKYPKTFAANKQAPA